MTDYKHEDNEEIGHYGQTLINSTMNLTIIKIIIKMILQ